MGSGGIQQAILQLRALMAQFGETGGNNHGATGTASAQLINDPGYGMRRRADHGKVRHHGQIFDRFVAQNTRHGAMFRIYRENRASEASGG